MFDDDDFIGTSDLNDDNLDAIAIASIGLVNLETAAVQMADWHDFDVVWDCWEQGRGTNFLCRDVVSGRLLISHTAGTNSTHCKVADIVRYQHDQTGRSIGGNWFVLAVAPHTEEGLKSFIPIAGTKKVEMATFK